MTRILIADYHGVLRSGLRKPTTDPTADLDRYALWNKLVEA